MSVGVRVVTSRAFGRHNAGTDIFLPLPAAFKHPYATRRHPEYGHSTSDLSTRAREASTPDRPRPAVAHEARGAPLLAARRGRCRRSRLMTASGSSFKECSQTRSTLQPFRLRARLTRWSRSLFRSNFWIQYSRLLGGTRWHRGQLCQKQPSTKTTTRSLRNVKSGLPGRGRCLRQPAIPCSLSNPASLFSVDRLPRDRMRDMVLYRCSTLTRPAMCSQTPREIRCHPDGQAITA